MYLFNFQKYWVVALKLNLSGTFEVVVHQRTLFGYIWMNVIKLIVYAVRNRVIKDLDGECENIQSHLVFLLAPS